MQVSLSKNTLAQAIRHQLENGLDLLIVDYQRAKSVQATRYNNYIEWFLGKERATTVRHGASRPAAGSYWRCV